jgi:hypothetical protein
MRCSYHATLEAQKLVSHSNDRATPGGARWARPRARGLALTLRDLPWRHNHRQLRDAGLTGDAFPHQLRRWPTRLPPSIWRGRRSLSGSTKNMAH